MPKHIRLSDSDCRTVLRDLRKFGYGNLTFDEVRAAADAIADGTDSKSNVIHVIMKDQIADAMEAAGVGRPE